MHIVPKGAPVAPNPSATAAADSRQRAINILMGGQQNSQATSVSNPSAISPEEMSALGIAKKEEEKQGDSEKSGDSNINEAPVEAKEPAKAEEEPKVPSPKEDPALSSHYANLARKEKALRAQIQAFKAEQAKWQTERDSAPKAPTFDESKYISKDRLAQSPLEALTEAGMSYDDITNAILNQSQIQTDPAIKAALQRLEAETKSAKEEAAAAKQLYADAQKQSYQNAINQISREVDGLVKANDTFEMIRETQSSSDVVELIEKTFQTDGTLLSVEEACQMVEDYLVEEATKLSRIKKLQAKIAASNAQAAPQSTPVKKQEQPQQQAKTLSNGMSATRPMSARERAIAAMEGRLK